MSRHSKNIKFSLDNIMSAISVKSGEFVDAAKIKYDIHSLRKRKEDELLGIGASVYRMFLRESFDEKRIAEKCSRIIELDKEIKTKEHEMEHVHESAKRNLKRAMDGKKPKYGREHHYDEKEWVDINIDENTGLIEPDSYEVKLLDDNLQGDGS